MSSRVARYTYGIEVVVPFNLNRGDHLAREDTCYEDAAGKMMVPNRFSRILKKVNYVFLYAMCLLIVNRIPRFQRRGSSGHLMNASFPSVILVL